MEDDTVTLRDRDSLEQMRVPAAGLAERPAAPAARRLAHAEARRVTIDVVREGDIDDLLPLMRATPSSTR